MSVNKVVVLGSINQDVIATAVRLPTPGETVLGNEVLRLPGGKGANQAVAVANAAVDCRLIGAVGDDAAGAELREFLDHKGVDVRFVREVDASTGTAVIVVGERGENTIVVVPAANSHVIDDNKCELNTGDVLLAQFEVPADSVAAFFRRGRSNGCLTILNPSPVSQGVWSFANEVDVLVLNESELSLLSGKPVDAEDRKSIQEQALELKIGRTTVVTLGEVGLVAVGELGTFDLPGSSVEVVDTTGAGDCFVGSLAAELASGAPFESALAYANHAASLCVTRRGAAPSMPSRDEVIGDEERIHKSGSAAVSG